MKVLAWVFCPVKFDTLRIPTAFLGLLENYIFNIFPIRSYKVAELEKKPEQAKYF